MTALWTQNRLDCAKALFGRALRVQLAEWILERGDTDFFLGEAQQQVSLLYGAAPSAVRQELNTMRTWGLVESERRDGRVYFDRVDSALWLAFEAAISGTHAES